MTSVTNPKIKMKRPRGRPRKNAVVEMKSGTLTVREPVLVSDTMALINALTVAARDPAVVIDKLDWLMKARAQLLADEAEQDFNDAMGRVQAALEPVRKDASNPQTHSKYATLAALDAAIRPFYSAEGFALSFDTADHPDPLTIVVVCYVTRGRAKRTYSIPMPCDGKGPKGNDVMSRTHATGSAVSYGRRYLEGMIFNVVIADRIDDDGNAAGKRGGYIRPEQPVYPEQPEKVSATIGKGQLAALKAIMSRAQVPEAVVLETFNVESLDQLTEAQFLKARNKCNAKLKVMFENEQKPSLREQPSGEPSEQAS